jgi:hypothetical protein
LIGYYHRQIAEKRTEDRRKKKEESMFGIQDMHSLDIDISSVSGCLSRGPRRQTPTALSYEKKKT